jgi:tetratricopeptide (TPR) repeat protein
MMTRNVFPLKEVGDFFNKNFVSYKFDMEKGEGPTFASKYGVNAYPTLLFLNYKGDVVHKVLGYRAPEAFISEAQKALDPSKNTVLLEDEYKAGTSDSDILFEYAMKQYNAGEGYQEAAEKFFSTQSNKELLSETGWRAIQTFVNGLDSREFTYLLKKRKKFGKKYGNESVQEKIRQVCLQNVMDAAFKKDDAAFNNAMGVARKYISDDGKSALQFEISYAEMNGDWNTYIEKTMRLYDRFTVTDPDQLNSSAWNFYLHVEDTGMLDKALGWARQSIALDSRSFNNDTYAALLYKVGRYEEAMKYANKAIRLAIQNEEDPAETKALLNKIKKAMKMQD